LSILPNTFVFYCEDQKADGGTVYKIILINGKLKTGNRGQERELTGSSAFSRRRSAMECSVV
jgi:hypothetical protein